MITELEHLLDSLKVMTIATPWENGVWSAPLYYLYKNRAFWFFSSPTSRHIIGSKTYPDMMVAASIFWDDLKFSNIKGLQMRGKIEEVNKIDNMKNAINNMKNGLNILSVVLAYIKKFGIPLDESINSSNLRDSKNLRETNGRIDEVLAFFQKHYRSRFYRFVPTEMIYMDNSVNIGFKQNITLESR
ncbi:MAG: hypothetical protein HQK63_15440 [Desulfamplus sp.]|nr:hypothetical protein [Desulfamplus sp.]